MNEPSISSDIIDRLSVFNEKFDALQACLAPFIEKSYDENRKEVSLERINQDLTSVYTVISLTWSLLCAHGKNPKENVVLENELKRIRSYMQRLKEIEERPNAPRVDKFAAQRFLRNAMFKKKESSQHGDSSSSSNVFRKPNTKKYFRGKNSNARNA